MATKRTTNGESEGSIRCRKKMVTTSEYIYRALFLEGQNSDITIVALGVNWHLHKVYLCQSPYFASMFSGSWKETEEGSVEVAIEDPRVTCEALKIVLGSLYVDEIAIPHEDAIAALAAARFFQLDEVIHLCSEIMEETIKVDTVMSYHEVAEQYAMAHLRDKCIEWLERNLVSHVIDAPDTLRQISPDMMQKLVASPRLVVVKEHAVYILLSNWAYLKENSCSKGTRREVSQQADKYFKDRTEESGKFVASKEGLKYAGAFEALRLEHLINAQRYVEKYESDNILSKESLSLAIRNKLLSVLKGNPLLDSGHLTIAEEVFDRRCLRCGYILQRDTQNVPKLINYNHEVDIIFTYKDRNIRCQWREHCEPGTLRPSVLCGTRSLHYRLAVFSVSTTKVIRLLASTNQRSASSLSLNMETRALTIPKEDVTFPLLISANFLMTTP